jgi:uncharacterized membrane protein
MYNVAFFFHILGVLALVAGIVLAGAAFEAARRRGRPDEIALLLGLTRVGVALVGIGSLVAGAFGLWLVHLGRWGYGSAWVDASIVLFVVVMALGGRGGQRPKEARKLATVLAAEQAPISSELRAMLDDRVSRAENYGAFVLLLAIVALMCFKP